MEIRKIGGMVYIDKRKFYTFRHMDGRLVETKATDKETAKKYIENCLKVKLKEAA